MRKLLIAGNWKMNNGPEETKQLLSGIKKQLEGQYLDVEVLVCPTFIALAAANESLRDQNQVQLGAQNMHFVDSGAYTGEISGIMLKESGCRYVILGHSERRQYFGETDEGVNTKALKALQVGLRPIICVGETLDERKSDSHFEVVSRQIKGAFKELPDTQLNEVVVAYEPVWAIGTGETATPDQAQEMHKFIRNELANLYNEQKAANIRILYGGSMKPDNAEELLSQPDVDGGLIGGASLKAQSFAAIISTAQTIASK